MLCYVDVECFELDLCLIYFLCIILLISLGLYETTTATNITHAKCLDGHYLYYNLMLWWKKFFFHVCNEIK